MLRRLSRGGGGVVQVTGRAAVQAVIAASYDRRLEGAVAVTKQNLETGLQGYHHVLVTVSVEVPNGETVTIPGQLGDEHRLLERPITVTK
jgi:hypothetical protein